MKYRLSVTKCTNGIERIDTTIYKSIVEAIDQYTLEADIAETLVRCDAHDSVTVELFRDADLMQSAEVNRA